MGNDIMTINRFVHVAMLKKHPNIYLRTKNHARKGKLLNLHNCFYISINNDPISLHLPN